ncbi:uncharacterized protein LTR77_003253 [Saxophila tyrrhenica]|uniref:Uncharacterized protein n=1 Tax=Saxophila tyrrhenica TaxID=1690608 RepID=A0AAV9PHT7_9PEZI|nr:hypothetical protein LTR77_003253 [Saxophila tyrrhenica]
MATARATLDAAATTVKSMNSDFTISEPTAPLVSGLSKAQSAAQQAIRDELAKTSPNMSMIQQVSMQWTATPNPFWHDLSSRKEPSLALRCWMAQGKEVEKFDGVWMLRSSADAQRWKWKKLGMALPVETDLVSEEALEEATQTLLPYDPIDIFQLNHDVRSIIFDFVAGDHGVIRPFTRGNAYNLPSCITLPTGAVQAGSRQFRQETLLAVLRTTTLEIHNGPGNKRLQDWLRSLRFDAVKDESNRVRNGNGFNAIHRLSFPYFSRFPHARLPPGTVNSDVELMRRSPALQYVKMQWVSQELQEIDPTTGAWVDKSVSELRDEYRLRGMLDLRDLKRIVFVGPAKLDGWMVEAGWTNGHGALVALKKWFEAEFALRGASVRVVLE